LSCECEDRRRWIESTIGGVAGQEAAMNVNRTLAVVTSWPERREPRSSKQFMTIT
jgi:hypothetical protein